MSTLFRIELEANPMGVYFPGQTVKGNLRVLCKEKYSYQSITASIEGRVSMQLPSRNAGVFESMVNELKPLVVVSVSEQIAGSGKFIEGASRLPFTLKLERMPKGPPLVETYHGLFVNVQYILSFDIQRGAFAKNQKESMQILVQNPAQHVPASIAPATTFAITNTTHKVTPSGKSKEKAKDAGKFNVVGQLDTTTCDITAPLTGYITVESADTPVRSIEMHLCRSETCTTLAGDKSAKEVTYVQNTQIGVGDVARGFTLPVYVTFPRLLSCPTLDTQLFKAEFQANIVVQFENNTQVEQVFPLSTFRPGAEKADDMQFELPTKDKKKG